MTDGPTTLKVMDEVSAYVRQQPEVDSTMAVSGFSFSGAASNNGLIFTRLKDWKDRNDEQSVGAITGRAMGALGQIKDAFIFAFPPPAMPELGIGSMSKPFQLPHPPIHISTMSPDSPTVALAARKGWVPITANFCPHETVYGHWKQYVKGCADVGRAPTGEDWSVARNFLIGESDAQAEDWMMDPKGSSHYYYDYMWKVLLAADYTTVGKPDPTISNEDWGVERFMRSSIIWGARGESVATTSPWRTSSPTFQVGRAMSAGMGAVTR